MIVLDWVRAFGLTVVVEVPLYVLLLRRFAPPQRAVGAGVLANVVTHPALWFGMRALDVDGWSYAVAFTAAETVVILVEWLVLILLLPGSTPRRELAAVSALVNLVSAGLGLVLALA